MAGETAGRKGGLFVASSAGAAQTEVGRIRNWSVDASEDLVEVTSNDSSGNREYIRGTRGYTATLQSLWLSTGAQQEDLLKVFSSSGSRHISIKPGDSTTQGWAGTGFIRSYSVGGQHEDADVMNVEIQFSGAATYSTST